VTPRPAFTGIPAPGYTRRPEDLVNQLPDTPPPFDLSPKWQRAVHWMVDGFISGLLVHFFCLQLLSLPMPALLDPVVEWLESAKQSRVRLLLIFLYYLVLEVG
jgi:hypothetical protein